MIGHRTAELAKTPGKQQALGPTQRQLRGQQVGVNPLGHVPGVNLGVFHAHRHHLVHRRGRQGTGTVLFEKRFVRGDGRRKLLADFLRRGCIAFPLGEKFLKDFPRVRVQRLDMCELRPGGDARLARHRLA